LAAVVEGSGEGFFFEASGGDGSVEFFDCIAVLAGFVGFDAGVYGLGD
jgi:hypothetical protein